ncbi:uncharacterized protein [Haliotis asinina]|uniref:uncharacterized protein n=1 Tax=Haliotis asinina TaxID=109174 RepID=UPI003531E735
MKPSVLGTFHVCLLYFMFWGIFLHDCEGAATMYGGQGQSVTLFWNQTQGYQAFTIKDQSQMKTLITVSNYNTVTFSNRGNNGPPQFTGNLSSSGVGLFRFVLPDLQLTDAGKYRCFKSGPGRTWIPDCGVDLVVIQIQTLFMVVPDFVTPDSVVLSCHSSILPQHLHPEVVFTWRENDDVLTPDKRYSMGTGMNVWNVWKHFYSRLTISGVTKKDCWRKYSCRVEFEGQILSNWSKEYILGEDYSNSEDTDVTGAREGTNAVMIFKMPLLKSDVTISSPAGETVIQVSPSRIYAWRTVTVRWTIVQVITSSSSTTAHVVLSNVTSADVGVYHCIKTDESRVTDCGRRLELLNTEMPRTSNHGNQTCSLDRAPTPMVPAVASTADGCVFSALAFVVSLVAATVH